MNGTGYEQGRRRRHDHPNRRWRVLHGAGRSRPGRPPAASPVQLRASGAGALAYTLAITALLPSVASAFQAVPTAERQAGLQDARWSAFVGCWEPMTVDETTEEGILCVRPAGEGVEMFTISEGEILTSDFLIADGTPRPIRAEGCSGEESLTFSDDGRRVFTRTAYTCEGVAQSGTGVLAHVAANQWVDARAIEVDGERTSWVQRYRLVGTDRAVEEGVTDPGFGMETASRTARFVAHRGVGFPQVEEAAREVDAGAVEAWLANRQEGFAPTAEDLEALADAGVPESVIDVVVAKSYPETFQVNPEGAANQRAPEDDPRAYRGARRPIALGLGFRLRTLGYGYGYVPAPAFYYGYGYGYPGYWGYRPGTVIIERRAPEPQGRIIRGRGYVRPGSSGGDDRRAVPRGQPSSSERPSATAPRRSGDDTPSEPRRAVRRDPGGGSGG